MLGIITRLLIGLFLMGIGVVGGIMVKDALRDFCTLKAPKVADLSPKNTGDYVTGDKIINYGTFIKNEVLKTDNDNIVTGREIKDFFLRLQLSLSEKRKSIPLQELSMLPSYLQIPYDMHITISKTHGIGYEFITPSDNPKINISTTDMPIEEYYFSKYTNKKHFSKATAMRINGKYIVLANLGFIAGKKVIAVGQRGNVLLKNIGIQYSKEDSIKEVEFLRIFGNNQEDFWKQIDPLDEATFLFNVK